jgi:hypothetical protein
MLRDEVACQTPPVRTRTSLTQDAMNDPSSAPRKGTGTDPAKYRRHRLRRLRRKVGKALLWTLLVAGLAVGIWYMLKVMNAPPPLP